MDDLKISLIIQDDLTIVPDDKFKIVEYRPEHRSEFWLADADRLRYRSKHVLAYIDHLGAIKVFELNVPADPAIIQDDVIISIKP